MIKFLAIAFAAIVFAATVMAAAPPLRQVVADPTIVVQNCSDQVRCANSTCRTLLRARAGTCVPLDSALSNYLVPAKYATLTLEKAPGLYSNTGVFINDPSCTAPVAQYDIVCGTCQQFSPRLTTCGVDQETGGFRVFVRSAADPLCKSAPPISDAGLPAGKCYAHPGVPGLYLRYTDLNGAAVITVKGYDDPSCRAGAEVASTMLAAAPKCFGGMSLHIAH